MLGDEQCKDRGWPETEGVLTQSEYRDGSRRSGQSPWVFHGSSQTTFLSIRVSKPWKEIKKIQVQWHTGRELVHEVPYVFLKFCQWSVFLNCQTHFLDFVHTCSWVRTLFRDRWVPSYSSWRPSRVPRGLSLTSSTTSTLCSWNHSPPISLLPLINPVP